MGSSPTPPEMSPSRFMKSATVSDGCSLQEEITAVIPPSCWKSTLQQRICPSSLFETNRERCALEPWATLKDIARCQKHTCRLRLRLAYCLNESHFCCQARG